MEGRRVRAAWYVLRAPALLSAGAAGVVCTAGTAASGRGRLSKSRPSSRSDPVIPEAWRAAENGR